VAVLLPVVLWPGVLPQAEPQAEVYPDLPEYFQPAHRVVRLPFGPVDGRGKVYVEGKGWLWPKDAPRPGNFTEAWMEEHFTHYLHRNAFYWAVPRLDMSAADGKLLAGTKVILGKKLDDLALVCTRTRDSRLINMYIPSVCLQARSNGPPPVEDDD
jgi:hypothetical protein